MRRVSGTTCSHPGTGRSPKFSFATTRGSMFRDLSRTSMMSYCVTR